MICLFRFASPICDRNLSHCETRLLPSRPLLGLVLAGCGFLCGSGAVAGQDFRLNVHPALPTAGFQLTDFGAVGDGIAIKSGGTNILIENCTIKPGHGISIGSGTTGGIHHLLVRHCTFEGTDSGIRIKSMRGAGGPVGDIRYTDTQMKDVANPIVLDLNYVDNNRPDFKGDPTKVPSLNDILIENVRIVGSVNATRIIGLPDRPITHITLRNVQISAERDLIVRDANQPVFDHVTRTIAKGIAAARPVVHE